MCAHDLFFGSSEPDLLCVYSSFDLCSCPFVDPIRVILSDGMKTSLACTSDLLDALQLFQSHFERPCRMC